MNILDHRILIPKSSELVWQQLSDISKNTDWRTDHSSISFLTSRRDGVGTRWRYTTPNGKEYVAETVAWYDGLGYEYTLVDGVPYRENKGRIRLQEIPEGTVVQWTFTYEMDSFLGGVRNTIALRRQVENDMIDSLKKLWQILNQAKNEDSHEAKSLMRDAPDYEARAQYKPRHPSVAAEVEAENQPHAPAISEPVFSDEDTRPGAVVKTETPAEPEPQFLSMIDAESEPESEKTAAVHGDETQSLLETSRNEKVATSESPVVYERPTEASDEFSLAETPNLEADYISPPGVLPEQPVIVEISAPETAQEVITQTSEERVLTEEVVVSKPSITTTEATPQIQEPDALDSSKMDTAEISVFDVFGIPKPSQTQEMAAVKLVQPAVETVHAPLPLMQYSGRVGLRLVLRRRRVKIRRPQ